MTRRTPMLAAISLLPLGLALACPPAQAAESYDNCTGFITSVPASIATQGVWCLDRDLSTAINSGAAITILTNNVTIDCNDFKLGGLAAGITSQANGIFANSRLNTTVRNCNIRGFRVGMDLRGGGHLVEDNRVELSLAAGIVVEGDASLVRRNQVRDTGEGLSAGIAVGISAEGDVDVEDNLIQGVTGAVGGEATVRGIFIRGGSGARAARNVVRGLVPVGAGPAQGIHTSGGQKVLLDDNRVVLHPFAAGSVAYRCNINNGSMRGNSSWGFDIPNTGCFDDGGNVHR